VFRPFAARRPPREGRVMVVGFWAVSCFFLPSRGGCRAHLSGWFEGG